MVRFLPDKELTARGHGSRTDIWRKRKTGEFIPPINLGTEDAPRNGTPDDELEAYSNALRSGKTRREAVEAAMAIRRAAVQGEV